MRVTIVPATSMLSRAASRPFSGSSTIRFESTTSAIVPWVMSTEAVLACDRDRFRQVAQLQRDVECEVLVRRQDSICLAHGSEPRKLCSDFICGRPHRRELIAPVRPCDRLARNAGAAFDCTDGDTGNHAAAAISDGAIDLPRFLREGPARQEDREPKR